MLSKKTIKTLDENNVRVHDRDKQDGQFYREIEFWSPAGEDVVEVIWYDGTNKGFIKAFEERAEAFDADDHAETYVEMRGKRGVPRSIRELINDADWIKNHLLELAKALSGQK